MGLDKFAEIEGLITISLCKKYVTFLDEKYKMFNRFSFETNILNSPSTFLIHIFMLSSLRSIRNQ